MSEASESSSPDGHAPERNLDAERAVLGCVLRSPGCVSEAMMLLQAEDFSSYANGAIFQTVLDLQEEAVPIDLVTVANLLHRRGQIEDVHHGYFGHIWDGAPCVGNLSHYAEIVKDAATRRRLRQFGERLASDAHLQSGDASELFAQCERNLNEIRGRAFGRSRPGLSFRELATQNPRLHPPLIDGILRERETANIVSVSKIGKSWLAYGLVLSIITGRPWLGRFKTSPGRVLLIDNELHKATIVNRIRTVAEALAIREEDYADLLEVWALRGKLRDIFDIGRDLEQIRGFKAVILDAKYRMLPAGTSENDNAAETRFYNAIDHYSEVTGASFGCVHHSSKGDQGDKRITDVGAGAGAQSRAADAHLVLREHEEKNCVVLEAAVRSFAPVEPIALRWAFPLWQPAEDVDPSRLRGRSTAQQERQRRNDSEGMGKIENHLRRGPATERQMRDTGVSKDRLSRLLGMMVSDGKVTWTPINIRGNETREYRLNRDVGD